MSLKWPLGAQRLGFQLEVYSLCIDVYFYERNRCTTKVLWVLKFCEAGGRDFFFSKSRQVERFLIFHTKLNVLSR